MNMSKIGKFESLKIVNEFDRALIDLYGVNMTDAHITRYEVLEACNKVGCPKKAAEAFAEHRGYKRVAETA
jgi:hypothetical protein